MNSSNGAIRRGTRTRKLWERRSHKLRPLRETLNYQKNIANLVEAETLLTRAVKVLKAYYSKIIKEESFLATKKQPEPPETWEEGGYKGQSAKGGTDAIEMIEHILEGTKTEEKEVHATG